MAIRVNDMNIPDSCKKCFRAQDTEIVAMVNGEEMSVPTKLDCKGHIASGYKRRDDCPIEEVDL